MEIVIRALVPIDAAEWARARFDALTRSAWAFGATAPATAADLVETARERLAASHDAVVIGAFDGERLVGTVGIRRDPARPKELHKALVWGMYVDEAYRGAGVGARLIEAAIEQARRWEGVTRINLAVTDRAPEARRLYERAGFRQWGYVPDALRVGTDATGMTYLALELTAKGSTTDGR